MNNANAGVTDEMLGEAGRMWCDEHWRIDDENPGWVDKGLERRFVGIEAWWLMKGIRYGVGYVAQRDAAK